MSKLDGQIDRSILPDGCDWAAWRGTTAAKEIWNGLSKDVKQKCRHGLLVFHVGMLTGRMPPKEKGFWIRGSDGIGKIKVHKPNPGWRMWVFRDRNTLYVTHIAKKDTSNDTDEAMHTRTATTAKKEHLSTARVKTV